MRTVLAISLIASLAGCATLPMMPWHEAALRNQLRQEGYTDIRISPRGRGIDVYAAGPQGQITKRSYSHPGMQLRTELTDRGDNSFMRQSVDSSGEVVDIEFWIGKND
jgi:hypothetical protein